MNLNLLSTSNTGVNFILVGAFVDDMLVIGSIDATINEFKGILINLFMMDAFCLLKLYLGLNWWTLYLRSS